MADSLNSAGYAQIGTQDAAKAQRLCALMLAVATRDAGVLSEEIFSDFYTSLTKEAAKRAWRRDRRELERIGVKLRYEHKRWKLASKKLSLKTLDEKTLAAYIVSLSVLAEDASFAYARELKYALVKLAGEDTLNVQDLVLRDNLEANQARLPQLLEAWAKRNRISCNYINKSGDVRARELEIYGIFGADGYSYLVAKDIESEHIKTYRADRFRKVEIQDDTNYDIPADFDLSKWRHLPFQIGAKPVTATFKTTIQTSPELLQELEVFATSCTRSEVVMQVADIAAAARWAIVSGLVPKSPVELQTQWRKILQASVR